MNRAIKVGVIIGVVGVAAFLAGNDERQIAYAHGHTRHDWMKTFRQDAS